MADDQVEYTPTDDATTQPARPHDSVAQPVGRAEAWMGTPPPAAQGQRRSVKDWIVAGALLAVGIGLMVWRWPSMAAFLAPFGSDPADVGWMLPQSPFAGAVGFFGGVGLFMFGIFMTLVGLGALAALSQTRRR